MNKELREILIKLIESRIEARIESFNKPDRLTFDDLTPEQKEQLKGPKGDSGKDVELSSLTPFLEIMVKNHVFENLSKLKLSFDDLTPEQKEQLKGPKGDSGKDVNINDLIPEIDRIVESRFNNYISKLKLSFDDLTPEQKEQLKGPKGDSGLDFDITKCFDLIKSIVSNHLIENRKIYSLSFDDLTPEQKEQLKGPKGDSGLDFDYMKYEDKIKDTLAENVAALRDDLKLKFSDLTEEEKDQLKFNFSNLTESDLLEIAKRAGRGQRGKTGMSAYEMAVLRGYKGTESEYMVGLHGDRGLDAPKITSAELKKLEDKSVYVVFTMSDGSTVETNTVRGLYAG